MWEIKSKRVTNLCKSEIDAQKSASSSPEIKDCYLGHTRFSGVYNKKDIYAILVILTIPPIIIPFETSRYVNSRVLSEYHTKIQNKQTLWRKIWPQRPTDSRIWRFSTKNSLTFCIGQNVNGGWNIFLLIIFLLKCFLIRKYRHYQKISLFLYNWIILTNCWPLYSETAWARDPWGHFGSFSHNPGDHRLIGLTQNFLWSKKFSHTMILGACRPWWMFQYYVVHCSIIAQMKAFGTTIICVLKLN